MRITHVRMHMFCLWEAQSIAFTHPEIGFMFIHIRAHLHSSKNSNTNLVANVCPTTLKG